MASKPHLGRRHSSTLAKSLDEEESGKKKKKEFVVHNQRHHHRIPSYGRNLNKLNRLQVTPAVEPTKQLPSSFSPKKSSFKQTFKTSHSSGNLARLRSARPKQRSETLGKKIVPAFQIGEDDHWQEEPERQSQQAGEKIGTGHTPSSTKQLEESHDEVDKNGKGLPDTPRRVSKMGTSRTNYLQHLIHPEAAPPQLNTENIVVNHSNKPRSVQLEISDENSFSPDLYLTSRFLETPSQPPRSESSQDTPAMTRPPSTTSLPSQKLHLGAARNRTQQKLLLQKQSSQPNVISKAYREYNDFQYHGTSRYSKELDRVSREFMNAERFRDIFAESISRVTSSIIQSKTQSKPMNAANEMRSVASRNVLRINENHSIDDIRKFEKDDVAVKMNSHGGSSHELDCMLREMWESF